ncbi:hypothetical protein NC652_034699 [Populus alba x Populus x berolinensis]|nr:hypothetical protein NC652_034691 [Populus alba x Populus x berolinensis]KAJ6875055.1 hypothetical protein NC652_034699 [Populus alba x Populus x berolinensis]
MVIASVIILAGVMNSLFSVYDIYDDLISRRVHSSDAEKFAEACPCPCNGAGWGFIWGVISFLFLCGAMYLGLVEGDSGRRQAPGHLQQKSVLRI